MTADAESRATNLGRSSLGVRGKLYALVAAVSLGAVAVGEVRGRALPVPARWVDEIHPLLGAAPPDCFARQPDADPWADFRGRRFSRHRQAPARVLLVGGGAAVRRLDAVESALGPGVEVVLAARDGYRVEQAVVLAARFATALEVTHLLLIDGEELDAPDLPLGATPEWSWHQAALETPLGERAARSSGLVRGILVRTPPPASDARLEIHRRGLSTVAALAVASGWKLAWLFEPRPSLAPDVARRAREAAVAALGSRATILARVEDVAPLASRTP